MSERDNMTHAEVVAWYRLNGSLKGLEVLLNDVWFRPDQLNDMTIDPLLKYRMIKNES